MARIADNLIKYECAVCEEQFIVSEHVANKTKAVNCPYCLSSGVDEIALMNDKNQLNELGCLGIYHDED